MHINTTEVALLVEGIYRYMCANSINKHIEEIKKEKADYINNLPESKKNNVFDKNVNKFNNHLQALNLAKDIKLFYTDYKDHASKLLDKKKKSLRTLKFKQSNVSTAVKIPCFEFDREFSVILRYLDSASKGQKPNKEHTCFVTIENGKTIITENYEYLLKLEILYSLQPVEITIDNIDDF